MDESSHGRITKLIRETVVMLCKNGVCFEQQLRVQGLIGVTIDDGTVFLVHMNECVNENECSSADIPVNSQGHVEASASASLQLYLDMNEQHQAEVCQWPKTSESSNLQYIPVKQETETVRTVKDLCGESHTTADVPMSVNASVPLLQVTEFGNHGDDDVIYVESTSDQTSRGSNYVKHEASEIWNPYSVSSTADQQGYGLSDYSERQLSNVLSSHAPIQDDTSRYSEFLSTKSGYGEIGVAHYLNASKSQKMLQNTQNSQSARMCSGQHQVVIVLYTLLTTCCSTINLQHYTIFLV